MSETHLDLDALADVLAEEGSDETLAHLHDCPTCAAALLDLESAMVPVVAALATLPEPELPADLVARLDAAVARERRALTAPAATTVTPLVRTPQRTAWLSWASGVAAAAVLVTGGALLFNGGGGGTANQTAAGRSPEVAAPLQHSTGRNYAKDGKALTAALPLLLGKPVAELADKVPEPATAYDQMKTVSPTAPRVRSSAGATSLTQGGSKSAEDPLATLRTTPGLAACLSGLTEPGVEGLPLAIDYASYEGKPALVVVLPSARADKVDIFVVGPGCNASDEQVLLFTRLQKPA